MSTAREVYTAHPTDAEIDDVLGQRRAGAVGTLNDDGSIHLAYVIFLHEDGRIYFETSSVTRKARNLAARSTVSFLVQGTAASGRSLMVAFEGRARILEGDAARSVNRRLREKYIRAESVDAIERAWGSVDDLSVEITPLRRRSWTGSVLEAVTEDALGATSYDDAWLPD